MLGTQQSLLLDAGELAQDAVEHLDTEDFPATRKHPPRPGSRPKESDILHAAPPGHAVRGLVQQRPQVGPASVARRRGELAAGAHGRAASRVTVAARYGPPLPGPLQARSPASPARWRGPGR
ncbi:hypothetical protein [Kitasatospora sp. NPDC001527]|uniref:hypothetical protein n=1 Tax=Kitasatospora sp. NPDC001527 TaxID=3154519 RepID=UPI00332186BA